MPKKIPKIVKEIQNYKVNPINFTYQKNISFSQISIFHSCQYRWKLQYKDKLKPFTSSINTVFGTAIHETIQYYLNLMYNNSFTYADRELDLKEYFQDKFTTEYKSQYKSNNNQHFSSAEEMREFFEDGVAILDFLKKKKTKYFSRRGYQLVGYEIPIILTPNPKYNNIIFMGYLDIVLYHEPTNTFEIIDLKTSTRSWGDYQKKDKLKHAQLILYKYFFSKQFNIPIENIKVEFIILKRKIYEESEYTQSRIQIFDPPSGTKSLNTSLKYLNDFIETSFNFDSSIRDIEYPKNISKNSCLFCPFSENPTHCGEGIIYK